MKNIHIKENKNFKKLTCFVTIEKLTNKVKVYKESCVMDRSQTIAWPQRQNKRYD